jgi:hypothetical protein
VLVEAELDDTVPSVTYTSVVDVFAVARPVDGDFDGTARSDLGAYEYTLATYDSDGDPHNNLQEYFADTNPTNALSYLRIVAFSNLPPWTIWFEPSSTNRRYTLECSANLVERSWPSVPGQRDVPGLGGVQSLSDTNTEGLLFYRVGARP